MAVFTNQVQDIPIDLIDPHPMNRGYVPGEPAQELAESLREKGQLQPGIVRPKGNGRFEIIVGEQRWHGCKAAGLPTYRAEVRPYSDREALEVMLIENIQRTNLRPMQEAEGFQRLLALPAGEGESVYTAENLAKRIGKNAQHVNRRLKLLRLPEDLRQAVEEGRLSPSVGAIVGRLPSMEMRESIKAKLFRREWRDGKQVEGDAKSEKEVLGIIAEEYMTDLRKAPFDRKDAKLVPESGSCQACPKRTGNGTEYAEELAAAKKGDGGGSGGTRGISAQVCTDLVCFRGKLEAFWERAKADALSNGRQVIEGEEAGKVFYSHGTVQYDCPYVDVNERLDFNDFDSHALSEEECEELERKDDEEKLPTWSEVAEGVSTILARDLQGRIRTLALRSEAVKVATEKGTKGLANREPAKQESNDWRKELKEREAAEKEKAKVAAEVLRRLLAQMQTALVGAEWNWELEVAMFRAAANQAGSDGANILCKMFGFERDPKKHEHATDILAKGFMEGRGPEEGDIPNIRAVTVLSLLVDRMRWGGAVQAAEFTKLLGIDVGALEKEVKREFKEKKGAKGKAKKGGQGELPLRVNRVQVKAAPGEGTRVYWQRGQAEASGVVATWEEYNAVTTPPTPANEQKDAVVVRVEKDGGQGHRDVGRLTPIFWKGVCINPAEPLVVRENPKTDAVAEAEEALVDPSVTELTSAKRSKPAKPKKATAKKGGK